MQILTMKKIITPAVRKEAKYVCDVTGKPAVARLALAFDYYGGVHDCKVLRVDMCEEVGAEVLNFLQSKFPHVQIQEQERLSSIAGCPMCGSDA